MAPSNPTITTPPMRRQVEAASFIGWIWDPYNGTWSSTACHADATLNIGPTYVGCMATTDTFNVVPTACLAGSLIFPSSFIRSPSASATVANSGTTAMPCSDAYGTDFSSCATMFYFDTYGATDAKTEFFCARDGVRATIYHDYPGDNTDTGPGSSSKAWIAGAVVGPIAGLAIIVAIVYLLLRRRRRNRIATGQIGTAYMGHEMQPHGVGGYSEVKPYPEAKPPPYAHEATSRSPQELYSDTGFATQELSATSPVASTFPSRQPSSRQPSPHPSQVSPYQSPAVPATNLALSHSSATKPSELESK